MKVYEIRDCVDGIYVSWSSLGLHRVDLFTETQRARRITQIRTRLYRVGWHRGQPGMHVKSAQVFG